MGVVHQCLNCGAPVECDRQPTKQYRISLDDSSVSLLFKIWGEVIRSGRNDVHVGNIEATYTERSRTTQLRLHALITKVLGPTGKQLPSRWLITTLGGKWLRKEAGIHKTTVAENNRVVRHEGPIVMVTDFRKLGDWGPHFQWSIVDDQLVRTNDQSKLPL